MPTLMLIRHGETDYVKRAILIGRTPGVHLNEKGRREALAVAESLKAAPIEAIYTSPIDRAVETATPLGKARGLKPEKVSGLSETDLGDWKGISLKKASKLPEWKIVQAHPSRFRFPNGESFQEEQTRLVGAVENILSRHKDNAVIAVFSHADPIKLTIAYYLGMPLDNFQRIACHTGSVSALHFDSGSLIALFLNRKPPFGMEFPKTQK